MPETRDVTEEEAYNTPVDTSNLDDVMIDNPEIDWMGGTVTMDQYEERLKQMSRGGAYAINAASETNVSKAFAQITDNIAGIFGMPYQFPMIVDPPIEKDDSKSVITRSSVRVIPIQNASSNVGRKFNEKILSVAPILFLTPGEPLFMAGYGRRAKKSMINSIGRSMISDGDNDYLSDDIDEGRFYSFSSNFQEYKKYANVALRALALFMGIENVIIPVPGKSKTIKIGNIDVEDFMNSDFTKMFGTNCVVPFFLDAETSISEDFGNETTESMLAQQANSLSSGAREIQYLMGGKNFGGGLAGNVAKAVKDLGTNLLDGAGSVLEGLGDVIIGHNMFTRLTNELTTIVSGGKIVFPEIWADSSYNKSYSINLKLRSPDPDPVSIFLNIYMPIILLISMAAPRQLGNSSNSFESPFLVRATYKSIFNCDLGLISSLSITKGAEDKWNVMGQPMVAEVQITLKDLYQTMFISKRMGLISNTAQMDYLATMAGIDLNDFEPGRIVKLWATILGDTPRDWASDFWGGFKRTLNQAGSNILSIISDTRYLG